MHEVDEISQCFDADWSRTPFEPGEQSHLIWCIGNGRQRIGQFIDEAKHSLWVQNERYQDPYHHRAPGAGEANVGESACHGPASAQLKKEKLIEGVERLAHPGRCRHQSTQAEGVKLHAKLLFADGAARSLARSTWRRAASTAAASWPSKSEMNHHQPQSHTAPP